MRTKLNDIANRFPLINNLVQKINLKKRKDSVILGAVIAPPEFANAIPLLRITSIVPAAEAQLLHKESSTIEL